jgi:hypothetical protein
MVVFLGAKRTAEMSYGYGKFEQVFWRNTILALAILPEIPERPL